MTSLDEHSKEFADLWARFENSNTLRELWLDHECLSDVGWTPRYGLLNKPDPFRIDMASNNRAFGRDGAVKWLVGLLKAGSLITDAPLARSVTTTEGIRLLVDVLKTNTTVVNLDLSDNFICDEGADLLAECLQINTTVQTLNLRNNYITYTAQMRFMGALESSKTLKGVDFSMWLGKIRAVLPRI